MKNTTKRNTAMLVLTGVVGIAMGMGTLIAPGIGREGSAQHIAELSKLETQPFDASLLSNLTDWTHGKVLDATALEDKVVVIGLVDSGSPQSMLTLSTLARYERQNADDGLVVLAVHPELGWDTITEKVNDGFVKVQVAKDPGNAFATALGSDDAPDLYLIDRAGQLRYADIESRSLKRAVGQLLKESKEEAVANAKLQAEGVELAALEKKNNPGSAGKSIPSEAYANANWPSHNSRELSATNFQGKPLPAQLGNEEWISEKKDIEGKVLILDFWATWCGPCRAASPTLEQVQRDYEGKVEVLAIGGASDDEGNHKKYVYAHNKAYSNLYDKKDTINDALNVRAIPHTVIMSTDGVIRWQGNPLNKSFPDIVRQVVEADPMFDASLMTSTDAGTTSTKDASQYTKADYDSANWPSHNTGNLYAKNHQGKALPVNLGSEKWLTPERDLDGKVIMLDFWATWCGPCKAFSPVADRLQKKYDGKLEVVAISGQSEPEGTVSSYLRNHKVSYSHVFDGQQRVYNSLGVTGIPHVVVLSSDGVIRWQGFPGDHAAFERTLDQIINADPMTAGN